MTQTHFLLLLFVTLISFTTTTRAQERAPHGLVYENPMAFSPSAYSFFHPKADPPSVQDPCDGSRCAPLPVAATVQSSLAQESRSTSEKKSGSKVGAGGIAGLIFGFIFVVLLAMGAYYAVSTRRTNSRRKTTVIPSA